MNSKRLKWRAEGSRIELTQALHEAAATSRSNQRQLRRRGARARKQGEPHVRGLHERRRPPPGSLIGSSATLDLWENATGIAATSATQSADRNRIPRALVDAVMRAGVQ